MRIHITLVAYALDIAPLVESLAGSDVTWHIYRHSNNPVVIESIDSLLDRHDIYYHPHGVNRGLAKSWNDGLVESQQMSADVMVIANDDIQVTRHDLDALVRYATEHPEFGIVECNGLDVRMNISGPQNFALAVMNPLTIEKVGYFDENLFPIYFEDTDYSRRCGLAGVPFGIAEDTYVQHMGSSTIGALPELHSQNNVTFHANHNYYCNKWGGSPGSEEWRLPFNSENFDWKITEDQRHDPYVGYGRKDREIVKI
jgi:GT2 family glycosyltransferase